MEFSKRLSIPEHLMRTIWRHSLNDFSRKDLLDFFDGAYTYAQISMATDFLHRQGFLSKSRRSVAYYYSVEISCEAFYFELISSIKKGGIIQ